MLLANFPHLNQLADTSEVNREFDCVPTSIAACLQWLLNKPFDGGAIKDAVYGKAYTGSTAAANYVSFCEKQGVRLFALNGTPAQLVADIKAQLQQQHPLIGTEPDPYANPSLGWSHVVAFIGCDEPAGTITCLDPFGGHIITLSDAEWEKRLLFHQVWSFQKLEAAPVGLVIPANWHDDGVTLTAPNGVTVKLGFREWVLSHNWDKDNWPLEAERSLNPVEYSNVALGAGSWQPFRWKVLEWTEKRGVFEGWCGQELLYLRSKVEELYSVYQTYIKTAQVGQAQPGSIAEAQTKQA